MPGVCPGVGCLSFDLTRTLIKSVKLPVVDRIHPEGNKFTTSMENKAIQVTQNL